MSLLPRKLRVGLIFGGRSCEHEVSLASAASVLAHLDREKYEVTSIAITRDGRWRVGMEPEVFQTHEEYVPDGFSSGEGQQATLIEQQFPLAKTFDVIFPVLHGTYGEDGALQGLLEMADVPYVGCGILGSALGMDKEKMKLIFRAVGLPVVDSLAFRRWQWEMLPDMALEMVEQRLGYPCFVKPANAGSSIGVGKAFSRPELEQAMQTAFMYDSKILIEHALHCRELECSVLGNYEPFVSGIGEVLVRREFYDYTAKYLHGGSRIVLHPDISLAQSHAMRQMAVQAFQVLDLSGLARVDFFLEHETGQIYINEVNTLPSFTPACMYCRLCEEAGLSYSLLLDRLIELALERYADHQRNRTTTLPLADASQPGQQMYGHNPHFLSA